MQRPRPRGLSVDIRGRARVTAREVTELRRQLGRAMAAAGVPGAELALSLSDDRELRALNRTFAREDHATDVLSFAQQEARSRGVGRALGDIVISVPTARRQARAGRRPLLSELVHLAVHGLAHLLGYDHATKAEERVMFAYETRLRAQAAARGPVRRVKRG